jgi:hypothetical protein
MITHFLIDTLNSKLRGDIIEILLGKNCFQVADKTLPSQQLVEELLLYTCGNTLISLVFKGDTLLIDIQGEGAEEFFNEVCKILPPEHTYVRRVIRGL